MARPLKNCAMGESLPPASALAARPPKLRLPLPGPGLVLPAALVLALVSCSGTVANFDEYRNTNLIPRGSFNAPEWVLDDHDGDSIPATNPYATFEQVDGLDNGAYGSEALLRATMTTANPDVPATEPIYRLETKNLLTGGNMEGADPFTLPGGGSVTPAGAPNQYFTLALAANEAAYIDLAAAINPWTANAAYSLSFRIKVPSAKDHFWRLTATSATPPPTAVNGEVYEQYFSSAYANNFDYRYPFMPTATAHLMPLAGGLRYLWFNSLIPGETTPAYVADLDDIGVTRADFDCAVRLTVPRTDSDRPILQGGGFYTLKILVRKDMETDPAVATGGNYKLFPSHFSISVHNSTLPNTHGAVSQIAIGSTAINNWTELSATFAGPSNTSGTDMKIALAPSQLNGPKTPGSLLIAWPRLYWSPD